MSALFFVCEQIFKEKFFEKIGKELKSNYDYYNIKSDEYQSKFTNNCFSIYMRFDETLKKIGNILNFDFNRTFFTKPCDRQKLNTIPTLIVNVTINDFMRIVEKYDFSLEDYEEKIINGIKIEDFKEPAIFDEGYDECDLLHILIALKYKDYDIKKICNYAREDHKELFPKIEGAVYHRNRLYIPVNGNYLVLSKNPYDFVWASTGNNYCSCFNIDSLTHYIQASPFMCTIPWFFMCYYTDGTTVKFSAFKEKKFKIPQMYGRFWCYKINNEMYYDKIYCNYNCTNFISVLRDWFFKRSDRKILVENEMIEIPYNTYLDSLRFESEVNYCYSKGQGGVDGETYTATFQHDMEKITYNPSLTVDMLPVDIVDNVYTGIKICPITGLKIDFNQERHWLAKYLDKPCKNIRLFTYSTDDNILIYNNTRDTRTCLNLEEAKDVTRRYISTFNVDCIVLRIVSKNKVNFQPFYKKGE